MKQLSFSGSRQVSSREYVKVVYTSNILEIGSSLTLTPDLYLNMRNKYNVFDIHVPALFLLLLFVTTQANPMLPLDQADLQDNAMRESRDAF